MFSPASWSENIFYSSYCHVAECLERSSSDPSPHPGSLVKVRVSELTLNSGESHMTTKKSKSKKAASKPGTSKTRTVKSSLSKDPLPTRIFAQASPRSVGGVSMFEGQ